MPRGITNTTSYAEWRRNYQREWCRRKRKTDPSWKARKRELYHKKKNRSKAPTDQAIPTKQQLLHTFFEIGLIDCLIDPFPRDKNPRRFYLKWKLTRDKEVKDLCRQYGMAPISNMEPSLEHLLQKYKKRYCFYDRSTQTMLTVSSMDHMWVRTGNTWTLIKRDINLLAHQL